MRTSPCTGTFPWYPLVFSGSFQDNCLPTLSSGTVEKMDMLALYLGQLLPQPAGHFSLFLNVSFVGQQKNRKVISGSFLEKTACDI